MIKNNQARKGALLVGLMLTPLSIFAQPHPYITLSGGMFFRDVEDHSAFTAVFSSTLQPGKVAWKNAARGMLLGASWGYQITNNQPVNMGIEFGAYRLARQRAELTGTITAPSLAEGSFVRITSWIGYAAFKVSALASEHALLYSKLGLAYLWNDIATSSVGKQLSAHSNGMSPLLAMGVDYYLNSVWYVGVEYSVVFGVSSRRRYSKVAPTAAAGIIAERAYLPATQMASIHFGHVFAS